MRRLILLMLLSISIPVWSIAQTSELDAWFDLQRAVSGAAEISGMAKNKTNKAVAFSYSMKLTKTGPSGKAISTQSGSFTLQAKEEKSLSMTSINLGNTASFEINLKVFDDEKVVAEKVLLSDKKFISDFQKLLPKPTKAIAKPKIKKSKIRNTDVLEIEGLIIDETRSKTGRDFYDQFYGKWIAPRGVSDFTITIRELPARGRGARVAVEVNGNTIIQRMLQPRLDIIELLAEQSVNVVKKHLVDRENLKNDLEEGDQKGSGIF